MPTNHLPQDQVRAVLDALCEGHRRRDAGLIGDLFAPDAHIFNLAPPLSRSQDPQGLADWLASWDGPVEQTLCNFNVGVNGGLAVCHGLVRVQTTRGGEAVGWWMRATYALARGEEGWRITHEHTSVPFHMDGSYRAALDLEP